MNTNSLGNIGLGAAIEHFTSIGYPVSIPLTDTEPYDLVVEQDKELKKVFVRYTRGTNSSGHYEVFLRSSGRGVRGRIVNKPFDNGVVDLLFIKTPESQYVINAKAVSTKSSLTLNDTWKTCRVF